MALLKGGFIMGVKRNVVSCILLSIFTCGLYELFGWLPGLANDLNAMDSSTKGPDGVTVILLTLITCGIYQLYFIYTASKRIYYMMEDRNYRASDNSLINLLVAVFGFSIVSLAIMQNDLNNCIDA